MILSIKTIENMMKIMLIVLRVSLDCFPLQKRADGRTFCDKHKAIYIIVDNRILKKK